LEHILQPQVYPELYGKIFHKVGINYYPPRGDNKEGWDNIDIFGWLGYPMQIKIDFLCRDSILAAPIVLDLVLFLDLAQRCDELPPTAAYRQVGQGRTGSQTAIVTFQVRQRSSSVGFHLGHCACHSLRPARPATGRDIQYQQYGQLTRTRVARRWVRLGGITSM